MRTTKKLFEPVEKVRHSIAKSVPDPWYTGCCNIQSDLSCQSFLVYDFNLEIYELSFRSE